MFNNFWIVNKTKEVTMPLIAMLLLTMTKRGRLAILTLFFEITKHGRHYVF